MLRSLSLLTLANLWSAGATLLLFAIAARALDGTRLGQFALLWACSQLMVLVADAGLTTFMIRDIVAGRRLAALWRGLRRRLLTALVLGVPIGMFVVGGGAPEVAALVFVAAANATYAALVPALLALGAHGRVLGLQTANGAGFVIAGMVASVLGLGPLGFLLSMGVVYATLTGTCGDILIRAWRERKAPVDPARPAPFVVAGLAYGVNTTFDSLLLGWDSPAALAPYAAAQRPAQGFSAAGAAAAGVLLPHFVEAPRTTRTGPLVAMFTGAVAVGAAIATVVTPLLDALYGGGLVRYPVVAIVFAAYAADLVLIGLSMNLLAHHHERGLAVVACIQLAATVALTVALLPQGATGVAAGILAGRFVGFVAMVRLASLGSRARA